MNRTGNKGRGGLLTLAGAALACGVATLALWSSRAQTVDAPTERAAERRSAEEQATSTELRGRAPVAEELAAAQATRAQLADARAPERRAPQSDPEGGAVLRGRVADDRGLPVATTWMWCTPLAGGETRNTSFEDPAGAFSIELAPGRWIVEVGAQGHVITTCHVELPDENELLVTLPRAARARGIVLAPHGAPSPTGAFVYFARPNGQVYEAAGEALGIDESGTFDIELRTAGENRIVALADGYARSLPLAIENVPGAVRDGLVLQLRPSGALECLVLDAGGRPASGARISVREQAGAALAELETDEAGRARARDLPAGVYDVLAEHIALEGDFGTRRAVQVEVELDSGATETVELSLASASEVLLIGTVHRGGVPLTGAYVQAESEDGRDFATATDVLEGAFQLTLDGPGDYRLMFLLLETSGVSIERIQVPAVARHEVEIELPSGAIAGTVRGPDGRPAAGIVVSLAPDAETGDLSPHASYGEATTDAHGAFRFSDLRDGRYELTAPRSSVDPGPFARSRVTGLEITGGEELGGVDIALTRGTVLTGIVLDAQGKPGAHARVVVVDARGRQLERSAADENGRYELRALPPGPARAIAFTRDQASAVRPIVLGADAATECELRLAPMGSLAIRVRDRDGAFVGGALRVVDRHGVEFATLVPITVDDSVTPPAQLLRVPPGRYTVSAENHSDSRAEQTATVTPDDVARAELVYP